MKKNIWAFIIFMVWLTMTIIQLFTSGLLTQFLPLIAPREDVFCRQYISLLKTGDLAQVDACLAPGLVANSPQTLPVLKDYLNKLGDPVSMHLLNVSYIKLDKGPTPARQLSYYADFSKGNLFIQIVLVKKGDSFGVYTLQNQLLSDSFEKVVNFNFWGKSWFHYIFLLMAFLLAVFTFIMLARCLNSAVRRKWLWIPFIVAGFGRVGLVWNDASWHDAAFQLKLFGFQVFSGGIHKEAVFQPWTVCASLPLGAIVFYFRHMNGKQKKRSS